jgi:hypothetical protein
MEQAVKLRRIYFRLISKDFFSMENCENIRCLTILNIRDVGKYKKGGKYIT